MIDGRVKDLAARLKTKYPDYADIGDQELVDKVVAKHPEYKSYITEDRRKASRSGQITGAEIDGLLSGEHGKTLRNFFGAIKWAEGGKPNIIVGGKQTFDPNGDHPNIVGVRTAEGPSTAAGDFQMTGTNWYDNGIKRRLGAQNFSPENQLRAAVMLFADRDNRAGLNALLSGDINTAINVARKDWAALPGSRLHKGRNNTRSLADFMNRFSGGDGSISLNAQSYLPQAGNVPQVEMKIGDVVQPQFSTADGESPYAPITENWQPFELILKTDIRAAQENADVESILNNTPQIGASNFAQNPEIPFIPHAPESAQASIVQNQAAENIPQNAALIPPPPSAQPQATDADYQEYLKYTQKTDSPENKAEFYARANSGKFSVSVGAHIDAPQGIASNQTENQAPAQNGQIQEPVSNNSVPVTNASANTLAAKTDREILGAAAGNASIDLRNKPKGENTGRYLLRTALQQIAPQYGLTEDEINQAIERVKSKSGRYSNANDNVTDDTIDSAIRNGKSVVNFTLRNETINDILRARSGDDSSLNSDLIDKNFRRELDYRSSLTSQGQEQAAQKSKMIAESNLSNEQKRDQMLRRQAEQNVTTSPFADNSAAGIEAEYQRLKNGQLSSETENTLAAIGESLQNQSAPGMTDQAGRLTGGVIGGLGRLADNIAGIERFSPTRLIEDYAVSPLFSLAGMDYKSPGRGLFQSLGNGARIISTESAKGSGIAGELINAAGGAVIDVPKLIGLSYLPGGAIVGLAIDVGTQSAGRGEDLTKVGSETAKGAVLGALFGGASKLSTAVQGGTTGVIGEFAGQNAVNNPAVQLATKSLGEAVRIGAIFDGGFAVEKISGATDEEAFKRSAINVIFDIAGRAGSIGKVSDLAGKIFRMRKGDNAANVTVDAQGNVKLLRGEVDPRFVDAEFDLSKVKTLELDADGVYKESAELGAYSRKRIGEGQKAEEFDAMQPDNVPNNAAPRELAAENPRRIEAPQPEAVQKIQTDSRVPKIVEALKSKDVISIEELQKFTRYSRSNIESSILDLYAAKQVEILPDNSIRFIGGNTAHNQPKSLFERAAEIETSKEPIRLSNSPLESEIAPEQEISEFRSETDFLAKIERPQSNFEAAKLPDNSPEAIQNQTASVYENLPQQKAQEVKEEKPVAQVSFAERPNIAEKLDVFTERGRKASVEPKVVDVSDLLTSLDENYPQAFQPRDRSRAASKAQISEIAGKLNPAFLGDSPKASDGRPLVVPVEMPDGTTKYAVISGNGRTAGIREAYNLDNDGAKKYSEFVRSKGDTPAQNPVYVGVLDPQEVDDFSEFAKEANESATAQMSASEQAMSDAGRLDASVLNLFVPSDDGTIHGAANRDFIRTFIDKTTSTSERNRYVDADGKLNQEGLTKVKNAIFAKAFATSEMGMATISRMAESTDSNIKNITNALLSKAGELSSYAEATKDNRRHKELDIAPDFARAMEKYSELKDGGTSLDDYISQGTLFGADTSPLQTRVMQVFDFYKRRTKAVRSIIDNYIKAAEALGDPNQQSLFGAGEIPSKEELFEGAVRFYEQGDTGEDEAEQIGLFNPNQGRKEESAQRGESGQDAGIAEGETRSGTTEKVEDIGDDEYDFSSTQVNIPAKYGNKIKSFARKIIEADDLADDGFEENPHITVKYGIHTENPDEIIPIFEGEDAVTAVLGKTAFFAGKDKDVVIIKVKSKGLRALNKEVAGNTDVTDTFPTYKPHVTLAYVKKGAGKKYAGLTDFEGTEIDFNEIAFSDKSGEQVNIPLGDAQVTETSSTPSNLSKNNVTDVSRKGENYAVTFDTGQIIEVPQHVGDENKAIEYASKAQNDLNNDEDLYKFKEGAKDLSKNVREASEVLKTKQDSQIAYSKPAPAKSSDIFYSQLEKTIDAKMPNRSRADQIKAIIKNGQVKQEEIDWIGINEYLDTKEMFTKDEVLNFVRENNVEIKEVVKDQIPPEGRDPEGERETHHEDYVLPNGENYKELLLTLPSKFRDVDVIDREMDALFEPGSGFDTTEAERKTKYDELFAERNKARGFTEDSNYKSSHYDEPNILAHIRFNERTDVSGNRTLFVEEIQSDWLQDLRKGKNVPDAPFKKSWQELAFKRALRYAAENNFDQIAWTTGEQQKERYDLSVHIERLQYRKAGFDGDKYSVTAYDWMDYKVADGVYDEAGLERQVGKEIAKKIVENAATQTKILNGVDLKIDGDGMTGFYDKIIPSFVNKYVKKWNAKAGTTEIETENDETEKVHAVTITPEMRESVLSGQPLFAKSGDSENYLFADNLPENLSEKTKVDNLVTNLRRLKNKPLARLFEDARISRDAQTNVVELNRDASELFRRAINDGDSVFLGMYLPPVAVKNMRQKLQDLIPNDATADQAGKMFSRIGELHNAMIRPSADRNYHYQDEVAVVVDANLPKGWTTAVQEELAHQADYRTRNYYEADYSKFADVDGYNQAKDNLRARYGDDDAALHNEVIAKTFRDDAETELGITARQIIAIQQKYAESLVDAGVDLLKIELNFSNIKKGREFVYNVRQRFARTDSQNGRFGENETRNTDDRREELRERGDPRSSKDYESDAAGGLQRFQYEGFSNAPRSGAEVVKRNSSEIVFSKADAEEAEKSANNLLSYIWDGKRDVPVAEAVMNVIRTGILASIQTFQNNIVSNTAMQVTEQGAKPFMVLADLLNPKTRKRHVAGIQPIGIAKGVYAAAKNELDGKGFFGGMWHGVDESEASKLDMAEGAKNPNFVRNTGVPLIDGVIELTKRFVVAGDRPFKAFIREAEKRGIAKVTAKNEAREKTEVDWRERMHELIENPTELMQKQIEHYADVTTFQNSNAFLDFYGKLKKTLTDDKELEKLIPSKAERQAAKVAAAAAYISLGQFATFVNTPVNVGVRTLEYFFPTGVVKAAWQFYRIGKSPQRAKWLEDAEIKRRNYLKHLNAERGKEDKAHEKALESLEKNHGKRIGENEKRQRERIEKINSLNISLAERQSRIAEQKAGFDKWVTEWNKKFAEETAKLKKGYDAKITEREKFDDSLADLWEGEDAGADAAFSFAENRAFAEAAGRAGFGGTIGGLMLLGVIKGLIEAVGTTDYGDEKEKAQEKRAFGIADDTIKIGRYRFKYSGNPYGYALKMGINLFEQYEREGTGAQKAQAMAKRFGKDLTATNPLAQSAFGDDFGQKDWAGWLGSKLATPIPRVLGEVGEVADEHPRKYFNEGFFAQFAIKIPKLRENLPESENYLGGDEQRGNLGRRVIRLIDPVKAVKENAPQSALPSVPIKKDK